MADKTWKAFERTVAKHMGSTRVGPMGTDTNDVHHDIFAIECKYRKSMPNWLFEAMKQADKKDGRTPVTFLREKGNLNKDVVVMYANDFYEYFGSRKDETCQLES